MSRRSPHWLLLPLLLVACGNGPAPLGDLPGGDAPNAEFAVGDSGPNSDSGAPGEVEEARAGELAPELQREPARTPGGLPLELPFSFTRPDVGEPLSSEEVTEFTRRLTGFWKQIDYFTWVYETCHGMDESTKWPEYLIWWHDVDAVKQGDTVTFRNNSAYGGSHNNAEPTSLVLAGAVAGYLASGDGSMGRIARLFALSFTAMMKGFVFDGDDPLPYLMARNIVPQNHAFTLPSGKKKAVDYTDWYSTYEGWNANRVHYPDNPWWGDIYVTTMRSKDDVPLMYRATGWLIYAAELAADEKVRSAAAEAVEYMQGFARDIVDSGYYIRSKDEFGQPYIPDQDLASLVDYTGLFPDAECDARLATALLAYGEPLELDCGSGQGSPYDDIAAQIHYFNYHIIYNFHMAALQMALIRKEDGAAQELLAGLVTRLERYQDPQGGEVGWKDASWERDVAVLLLNAASLGMPLTSAEARQVHKFHRQAVDLYEQFPNWDLWSPTVPDGTYDFRQGFHPKHVPEAVRIEDMVFMIEYCWSPFRNRKGPTFVDCEVVLDPTRWGE